MTWAKFNMWAGRIGGFGSGGFAVLHAMRGEWARAGLWFVLGVASSLGAQYWEEDVKKEEMSK